MKMESAVAGQSPLISLVVPVYNAGAWLDEAMASIRRQSFEAFEVLLVDDGSTDDSAQKCSRVCAEVMPIHFLQSTAERLVPILPL